MSEATTPKVYAAIVAVTEALSKEGITKSRKNQQQGYSFRGIDDVYNALAPELAKNKLCMLPRVLDRAVTERETKNGGVLFYSVVTVEFDLVSAEDGSIHTIRTIGEAMDSGDKSTNKSQSAAYKYAAMMAFCIPTEGDNDTENQTHEVAPKKIIAATKPLEMASSVKTTPPDFHAELKDRARIFADMVDSAKTSMALTDALAKGLKVQADLKQNLPEWSDRLMGKITAKQNELLQKEQAA